MTEIQEVRCDHCLDEDSVNFSINIQGNPKLLHIIRSVVEDLCQMAKFSLQEINQIILAVDEVSTNIIRHSHLGDISKEINYRFLARKNYFEVAIRDHGKKFKAPQIGEYTEPKTTPHGLGLILVHSIMDEVIYDTNHGVGTEIWMRKEKN